MNKTTDPVVGNIAWYEKSDGERIYYTTLYCSGVKEQGDPMEPGHLLLDTAWQRFSEALCKFLGDGNGVIHWRMLPTVTLDGDGRYQVMARVAFEPTVTEVA